MAKYKTTVTHLEMTPPFLPATPDAGWPDGISFTREMDISVAAYRALYDQVGRQWHWVNRRMLTDRQLSAIIHHPATEIFTLKNRDRAIGFVELNFKLFPQVEIVFVGIDLVIYPFCDSINVWIYCGLFGSISLQLCVPVRSITFSF